MASFVQMSSTRDNAVEEDRVQLGRDQLTVSDRSSVLPLFFKSPSILRVIVDQGINK
jgi:hypothetical protein